MEERKSDSVDECLDQFSLIYAAPANIHIKQLITDLVKLAIVS